MTQPPKKIYLQWEETDPHEGVTWCVDKIHDTDIEYVLNNKMGVNCPSCDVEITTSNAGGYRTFCDDCVEDTEQVTG